MKERLDKGLYNFEWAQSFPKSQVYNLPVNGSNHSPIIFSTEPKEKARPRLFRFEKSWLYVEACFDIIRDS